MQGKLLFIIAIFAFLEWQSTYAQKVVNDKEFCVTKSDCTGAAYAACLEGVCIHKPIFPLLTSEVIGIITLPMLLGLANVGGIGGGGLIIPLAMGCWGFNTIEAVSISNSTVFLGTLMRFFGFSIHQKHPSADRTVIDYDLASIMMPAVLLGAFSGLYISVILPEALIAIIITLILCVLTLKTAKQTILLCEKESREHERLDYIELQTFTRPSPIPSNTLQKSINKSPSSPDKSSTESNDSLFQTDYQPLSGDALDNETLKDLEERERTDIGQWRHHVSACALIGLSFIVQLIRDAEVSPSEIGIQKCGVFDTMTLIAFLSLNAFMVLYEVRRVIRKQELKRKQQKTLAEGELELTGRNLAILIFGSVLGGLVGSMGMGGAIVYNPVMLSLGVQPTVVAATGLYLVMYSQASNTAFNILMGNLPLQYAIYIGLIGCLGISMCLITLTQIIKRTGRQSVVVFVLTLLILASSIMVPIFSGKELIKNQALGQNIWAFKSPCT